MSATGDDGCPPFLAALGLDAEADERAIKRSYARRLKTIDPATEPQAFQALREAYEQALHWLWVRNQVARQEAEAASEAAAESSPPPPTAADAPAADETPQAGEAAADPAPGAAVFEAFAQRAAQVFADEPAARAALDAALADDRLINLEARTLFEWNVGCLLMNGWQPGHEFLFGPACEAFGWADDRRRLGLFGALGAAIDRAIDEKLMFFSQPRPDFDVQRRLIQRLRVGALPSDTDLRRDTPLMLTLAQRYPSWLRAITSTPNMQRWNERHEQLPKLRHESAAPAAAGAGPGPTPNFEPRQGRSSPQWMVIVFLMIVLSGLAKLIGSQNPGPAQRLQQPPAAWRLPATQPTAPNAPAPLWQEPVVSFESIARPGAPGPFIVKDPVPAPRAAPRPASAPRSGS